jgi:hypothetical protein
MSFRRIAPVLLVKSDKTHLGGSFQVAIPELHLRSKAAGYFRKVPSVAYYVLPQPRPGGGVVVTRRRIGRKRLLSLSIE